MRLRSAKSIALGNGRGRRAIDGHRGKCAFELMSSNESSSREYAQPRHAVLDRKVSGFCSPEYLVDVANGASKLCAEWAGATDARTLRIGSSVLP